MKIVKDLLLALINATLLLAAVCLFFLWQISNTVERASGAFAENLQVLKPVTSELKSLTTEVSTLRGDLQAIASNSEDFTSEKAQQLQGRISTIENRLDDMQKNVHGVMSKAQAAPEHLVEVAVTKATTDLSNMVFDLRGCTRPES